MTMPERLGKYPITAVIGKGSMGVIYRGFDPVIKRPVAIKTIRKELIEEDDKGEHVTGRFRREAQAAGALNHPGIVSVYEYGEDQQLAYIAMELVDGISLREYLARGTVFSEHDTVSLMAQLLDALQFAHDHAIWHRDIKPANIMVMGNGRIKLTDFGIARIESTDFTKTNVIMGTPGFIAPELYLGRDIDQRVDIFSAGVLFYLLLAGQQPFAGRPEAVMHDICYHDPAPPSSVNAQRRWPQYDAVVARALEKAPAKRFASAAAFREAILAAHAQPLDSTLSDATITGAREPLFGDASGPPSTPPPPGLGRLSTVATLMSAPIAATPAAPQTVASALGTSVPPTGTATSFTGTIALAGSTPPPTGWSAPVLAGVEMALARFIGPVARVLVRRAARVHKDIPSLTAAVVDSIDRIEDREAFVHAVTGTSLSALRARSSEGPETPVPSGPATEPPLTEAELDHMSHLLASALGPIARVVVKRAAAQGGTRREFLQRVAHSLEDDDVRERFMRAVAKIVG
jgi:serine/threonine-protein kinase